MLPNAASQPENYYEIVTLYHLTLLNFQLGYVPLTKCQLDKLYAFAKWRLYAIRIYNDNNGFDMTHIFEL